MSDPDRDAHDPPEDVARLAAALREAVQVRSTWRDAVLRQIALMPPPCAEEPWGGAPSAAMSHATRREDDA